MKQKRVTTRLLAGFVLLGILFHLNTLASAASDSGKQGAAPVNWLSTDYKSQDPYGKPLKDGQHGHMPPPLVFALINFGLLLALLGWKALPPLRRYAQSRHTQIKDALEESQRLREAAQSKLDECNAKVAKMDEEMATLVSEIRSAAELEHSRIVQQAEKQAEAMLRDAKDRIAGEMQRATATLRSEVLEQAVELASSLLEKHFTTQDQQSLVDAFVEDVHKNHRHKESRV